MSRHVAMEVAWSDRSGDDFNALLGKRVRLAALESKPELNGRIGQVFSWHENTGRCGVRLDGDAERMLALRPANIVPLEHEDLPRECTAAEEAGS